MKESSDNKHLKILGIIFLMVLLCLLVIKVMREGIFSNKLGINIAVVGDSGVSLLILRPDEDILGIVRLPERVKVKIHNSSAQYPLDSLWEYGVTEKQPFEIFEKSLGLSMGVAIPRIIKVRGEATLEEVLASLHKIGLKSDLSVRDRFLIRQYLADSVASKKVLEMDIPKNALDEVEEPDGKKFLVFNNVITLWTKNKFLLESILTENTDLSVNNLSGLSGLGIAVSRQLEAAGIRVIEVKTDPTNDINGTGCLFVSWEDRPFTVSFLVDQMGCAQRKMTPDDQKRGIELWLK